jgi:hypothetical protein
MCEVEPQPTIISPSPSPPQFRLRTLLLLCVVLAASLAVFGAVGIVVFIVAVGLAIWFRTVKLIWPFAALASYLLCLTFLWPAVSMFDDADRPNWPNIAALAVWLASVGVLLVGAVRGRTIVTPIG